MIAWLPELLNFEDYQNDWNIYFAAIYEAFINDFIKNKTFYGTEQIHLKKHPIIEGKEATFWHLISTGKKESERIPDLRRCERIKWPSSIIQHHKNIKFIYLDFFVSNRQIFLLQ